MRDRLSARRGGSRHQRDAHVRSRIASLRALLPFLLPRRAALQTGVLAFGIGVIAALEGCLLNDVLQEGGLLRWLVGVGAAVAAAVPLVRLSQALGGRDRRIRAGLESGPTGMALLAADGRWLRVNEALCQLLGRRRGDLLGRHFPSAEGHDRLALPTREDEPTRWEQGLERPDGGTVWLSLSASLVPGVDGRPRYYSLQAHDISDRKRLEDERKQATRMLEQRIAEQDAVAEFGRKALGTTSLPHLLDEAVRVVAETLQADYANILELEPDGTSLRMRAAVGWRERMAEGPIPAGTETWAGACVASPDPVVVVDLASETRFHEPELIERYGVATGWAAKIAGGRGPFGLFAVHWREGRAFTPEDGHFLSSMVNVLTTAIERTASEEETRHRALHDALTGLPNRTLFLDRLAESLARSQRTGLGVAVLLLDLDEFKVINDSLGHHAGDDLLIALAPRLLEAVRPGDTVARLGGDEFVILCEHIADERDAFAIAERVKGAWAEPFAVSAGEMFVSGSIGVALSAGGESPLKLLREADAAMYRAKDRGRGRSELFDEQMRGRALERLSVENDLRRAPARGELCLAYQPIVEVDDGRIAGVEALLRWRHPERGLVAPGDFIGLAEETGLIVPIGRWVLQEACAQAAAWQRANHDGPPLELCVNLSPRQLASSHLVADVAAALDASGLCAGSLSLEITESVLIDASDGPHRLLADLRALGVRLVLDDFGTGYSSLSCLKEFPLDGLKLDRSFVRGLGADEGDSAIVASVVTMARALDLTVVGEGVERPEQRDQLQRLGCQRAQGFLFDRPLWPEELEERLAVRRAELGVAS